MKPHLLIQCPQRQPNNDELRSRSLKPLHDDSDFSISHGYLHIHTFASDRNEKRHTNADFLIIHSRSLPPSAVVQYQGRRSLHELYFS